MAIWIDISSENAAEGSRNVRYMPWKVPIRLVSMAEITAAAILARVAFTPTARAASSRSRTAIR